ncbi:MAG: 3'-5' exonuclease [Patescibacteria group bacterium]|nr:3'-5' exonuclease [Patescibacteria group bacterium]
MKNTEDIDYIVWDLETTGFVAPECRILEIGCFVVNGDEIERKHWVLDNKVEIPEKITEITGITQEIIDAEGRDPEECLLEFLPYFKRCKQNVTHNGIRFDIPFMVNYAEDVLGWTPKQKAQATELLNSTAYDTASKYKADKLNLSQDADESFLHFSNRIMSMRVYGLKFNVGIACDELGIDRSKVVQHRAMADVELTHEIYKLIK